MGAGKTTQAGTLASRLGVRAVDTDALVERTTGRTIREIFAVEGESAFRVLEMEAVVGALSDPGVGVLSLGGGAYMTEGVRAALAQSRVVYLRATPATLVGRLVDTPLADRPLLGTADELRNRVNALFRVRDPVYAEADLVVDTDGQTPMETTAALLAALEEVPGE